MGNAKFNTTMKQTIKVKGMRCEHCEARVEQALGKIDGIASAKANHELGTVEVDYDPDKVAVPEIVDTIEDCGYSAIV